METIAQLRVLLAQADPALLTSDDRLALLDLFEKSHQTCGKGDSVCLDQSAVLRRNSSSSSPMLYADNGVRAIGVTSASK